MTDKDALKIASWLVVDNLCEEQTEYCNKSCIECCQEVQKRLRQMAQKEGRQMTNKEAIQFLKNMKGEEAGRAIGKEGFYAELCGYHIEALQMTIAALEFESKIIDVIVDFYIKSGRISIEDLKDIFNNLWGCKDNE